MYKLRIKIFSGLMAAALLAVIARLVHLQAFSAEMYRGEAQELLTDRKILVPERGRIRDRKGRILADNLPGYDVCLDYGLITPDEEFHKRWLTRKRREIAKAESVRRDRAEELLRRRLDNTWRFVTKLSAEQNEDVVGRIATIQRRIEHIRRRVGMTVWEQTQAHPVVTQLDRTFATEDMVGISIAPRLRRHYPYDSAACHVLGTLGPVTAEEIEQIDQRLSGQESQTRLRRGYGDTDVLGKRGIEKMCEETLRGLRGYRVLDRRTDEAREGGIDPENGADVQITLDIELQRDLTALLEGTGHNGSIAIISVPTGEVLSVVSVPTFNLNRFRRDYAKLAQDRLNMPLMNRAMVGRYPPGSTVKPAAALAGLAGGVVTPSTVIDCQGYLHTPSAFRCWIWGVRRSGHGPLDLPGSLQHSCNVYYYTVGQMLGIKGLVNCYGQFGLGSRPGTHLPGERPGSLPTDEWIAAHPGPGAARLLAIGQGPIVVTPLHVANVMATIARRGVFLSPVLSVDAPGGQVRRDLGFKPEHIDAVVEGMYKVVNDSSGTAYRYVHGSGAGDLGIEFCGKTGTATVSPQRWNNVIVRSGDMAWFAGFAPRENPQVAFAVLLEYAVGGGARNSAPVAREALRLCKQHGYLGPAATTQPGANP